MAPSGTVPAAATYPTSPKFLEISMRLDGNGWRATMLAALLAALSACEGGGGGPGPDPEPSVARALTATTATTQAAAVGTAVAEAPAVRVTDQRGAAMAGVPVTFTVAGGGGTVANATATTDASGIASAGAWTLGAAAGANTVTASHGDLSPVQFAATGQPRVPTAVTAVSATTQAALAMTLVAEAPAVRVTDQTGAVMQGVTVTFAVTTGSGSIPTRTAVTNAQGVASVGTWRVGSGGQNTVTATVGSIAPVVFNAVSQPRVATTITTITPTSQTAVAGTAVVHAPTVRVDDQAGEPLGNVTVTFAVTAGGGQVVRTSEVTNPGGLASAGTWTLGAAGQNTVTATVGQGTVGFNATAQARVASSLWPMSPQEQTGLVVGSRVPQPPAVRVHDQTGTPLPGAVVTFAVVNGGGTLGKTTATANGEGVASSESWTLGSTPFLNVVQASIASETLVFTALPINPCSTVKSYTVGTTAEGEWNGNDCVTGAGSRRDAYTVSVSGDPVVFTLTSPTVDTYLELFDADGRLVASNNNSSGTNSAIYLLAPAGMYRLHASTYLAQNNFGTYALTSGPFTPGGTGCRAFAVLPPRTLATTSVAADCNFLSGNADFYDVVLQPGETLTARMESTQLDPELSLLEPRGSRIRYDDNGGGGTTALVTYTNNLSIAETYRVIAHHKSDTTEGTYTIAITRN